MRLHFYNDEFDIVNPLGSRKTLHKISAFYFTVGNLHPKHRSKLKHIHPSILAYNSLIKRYGAARVLEPLISDIKKLQTDGIEVLYEGRRLCFKGTIVTVSADNLSAHSLAGFRGSFSSGRICRYCLCHYKDLSDLSQMKMNVLYGHQTYTVTTYNVLLKTPIQAQCMV